MAFCGALLKALYPLLPSIIRQHLAATSLYRRIESGKEEGAVLPRNILHQMPSLICPVAIMHHVFAGFTGSFP